MLQLHEPTISMHFFDPTGISSDGPRMEISIEDGSSGLTVLRATLTPEQFFKTMSNLGHVSCAVEFSQLDERVGLQHEHKVVLVPSKYDPEDKAINKALAPLEVDDWMGRSEDMKNPHNYVHNEGYRVGFDRWIPRKEN